MERTINGKQIKITKAGYLYINGIRSINPISPMEPGKLTNDPDALEVIHTWLRKNYTLSQPHTNGPVFRPID